MNIFVRLFAWPRRSAQPADHMSSASIERPAPTPPALAEAQAKRRLERLLRGHGMSRAAAAAVVREYFQQTPT